MSLDRPSHLCHRLLLLFLPDLMTLPQLCQSEKERDSGIFGHSFVVAAVVVTMVRMLTAFAMVTPSLAVLLLSHTRSLCLFCFESRRESDGGEKATKKEEDA